MIENKDYGGRPLRVAVGIMMLVLLLSGGTATIAASNGIDYDTKIIRGNFDIEAGIISPNHTDLDSKVRSFLSRKYTTFKIDPEKLKIASSNIAKASKDLSILKYIQIYNGLPVYSSRVIVAVQDGKMVTLKSNYHSKIDIGTEPKMNEMDIVEVVEKDVGIPIKNPGSKLQTNNIKDLQALRPENVTKKNNSGNVELEKVSLVIFPESTSDGIEYHLAYKIELGLITSPPAKWVYIVDANDSAILEKYNRVVYNTLNGKATGSVYPENPIQAPVTKNFSNMTLFDYQTSPNNVFWSGKGNHLYNYIVTKNPIDLSDVSSAILEFKTKYFIEEDYDFGYATISTDGINYYWYEVYTGNLNNWSTRQIDLSGFAGQQIWIGFFYITDSSVQNDGMYIDDIKIETNIGTKFSDSGDFFSNWNNNGFSIISQNVEIYSAIGNTGHNGTYSLSGLPNSFVLHSELSGPYVHVDNYSGINEYLNKNINTPATQNIDWGTYDTSYKKEQSNVFYDVNKVHDFFTKGSPFNIDSMNYQTSATVQYPDICNAFSDGTNIYFYGAGDGCEATSLFSDIIYHEYTHSVVDHVYSTPLPYSGESGALNEGWADYFATTINGNPCMDHFIGSGCMRNLTDIYRYPYDIVGEVHDDSRIVSGAAWDLRQRLGAGTADALIINAMKLESFNFTEYLEDIIVADDNNGNLLDGTPHLLDICTAFYQNHGINSSYCYITSSGTVNRSFSSSIVSPGATTTVTLTPGGVVADGDFYGVTETLPEGFTYVSTSADAIQTGQVVEFTKIGGTAFTYTVTAPLAAPGTAFTFSGTFKDANLDTGYVGGSSVILVGTGSVHNINKGTNYLTIQAAIDDANSGDEIHVDSGIYTENVNITKQLTLRGESNLTTIIEGNGSGNVVEIKANGAIIEGFGIRNGSNGIYATSSNTIIRNNTISNVRGKEGEVGGFGEWVGLPGGPGGISSGIYLYGSTNNTLTGNTISNMIGGTGGTGGNGGQDGGSGGSGGISSGIYLSNSTYNNIIWNTISDMIGGAGGVSGDYIMGTGGSGGLSSGVYLSGSTHNTITGNTISNMTGGMGRIGGDWADGGIGGPSSGIYLSSSPNNNLNINKISNISGGTGGTGGQDAGAYGDAGAGGMGGHSSGISLSDSTNNTLTGNRISNMTGGTGGTADGMLSGPPGSGGLSTGIYFSGSTNNTLSDNGISKIIGGAGVYDYYGSSFGDAQEGYGIYLETDSYQNLIYSTNNMDGDPILYLYNIDGAVIENYVLTANRNPTNLGKIVLIESKNTIIRNNTISNMTGETGGTGNYGSGGNGGLSSGIYLSGSINNTLTGNKISYMIGGAGGMGFYGSTGGLSSGIYLSGSINNTLTGNIISYMIGGGGGLSCCYEYGSGGSGGLSSGIYLSGSPNNILRNNAISYMIGGVGGAGEYGGSGGPGGLSSGIYLYSTTNDNLTNNAISNVIGGKGGADQGSGIGGTGGLSSGIYLSSTENGNLTNNAISNVIGGAGGEAGEYGGSSGFGGFSSGIYLSGSTNNTLRGNNVTNNSYGISLSTSNNNKIYNNIFNNTNHVDFNGSNINTWNITKQQGTNIIGGSYIGGNFWAYPNGTGFSQKCEDINRDGICDSSYALDSTNIDYLPLAYNPTAPDFTISTSPSSQSIVQGNSTTYNISLTSMNGFNSAVSLSASGLPANVTASFSPDSVTPTGTSTLTIQTSGSTPAGSFNINLTGIGGGKTHNVTAELIISSQSGTITVTTNNPGATFTITGPASYSGSGTSWSQSNAPVGTYSITFGSINGFNTPSDTPETLSNGGTITFSGTYTPIPDNGWSMDILANSTDTFGKLLNSTVNFGVNSIATDGYDGAPFDIDAAPLSPTGFDIRFSEPDVSTGELINDTKAPGISKNWTLLAQAPKTRKINITWSSENIPPALVMQIQEFDLNNGSLIGSPIDMKSVNLISFTAGAVNMQKGYRITASSQISHTISLSRGWNMISLPVNVSEASIGAIFGSNVTTVYGWTGTSYELSSTLEPKRGYWVLSSSNYEITVTGTPVFDRDITITRGWNMVGPVTDGIMVSSLPNVTTVYGWTGTSYTILDNTDTLTLTKGYWMLANAASTIQV